MKPSESDIELLGKCIKGGGCATVPKDKAKALHMHMVRTLPDYLAAADGAPPHILWQYVAIYIRTMDQLSKAQNWDIDFHNPTDLHREYISELDRPESTTH